MLVSEHEEVLSLCLFYQLLETIVLNINIEILQDNFYFWNVF